MYRLDTNKTYGEKAKWELHKNFRAVLNKSEKLNGAK